MKKAKHNLLNVLNLIIMIFYIFSSMNSRAEKTLESSEDQIIWTIDAIEWSPLQESQKNHYTNHISPLLKKLFPAESWPQKRLKSEFKEPRTLTDLNIRIDNECDSNLDKKVQGICIEIKELRIRTLQLTAFRK
jgi:hypothetical protein